MKLRFIAIMIVSILIMITTASCASASTEDAERIAELEAEVKTWKAAYYRRDSQYWEMRRASLQYQSDLEVRVWTLVKTNRAYLKGWQRANQTGLKYKRIANASVLLPNRALTYEEHVYLATKTGWPPKYHRWLYGTMLCESGGLWWAVSKTTKYRGPLQHDYRNGGYGWRLLNPEIAYRQGWKLFQNGGKNHWPECGKR